MARAYIHSRNALQVVAFLALSAAAPARGGNPADELFAVATRHYEKGRWAPAIQEWNALLTEHPGHARRADATYFVAECHTQLGQPEKAAVFYRRYLSENPQGKFRPRAEFRAAEAHYLQSRPQQALEGLSEFLRTHPDHDLATHAWLRQGEAALQTDHLPLAKTSFETILARQQTGPLAAQARWGLAQTLEYLGQFEEAERFYRLVAFSQGELADDAFVRCARLLFQVGRAVDAAELLRGFETQFPASPLKPHAFYWRGRSSLQQNQAAAAAEQFAEAQAAEDLADSAAYWRSVALQQDGQAAAAESQRAALLAAWPDSAWADEALRDRVDAAEDQDDAMTRRQEFLDQAPDSPHRAAILVDGAEQWIRQGKFADALEWLQDAEAPTDGGAALAVRIACLKVMALRGAGQPRDALTLCDSIEIDTLTPSWRECLLSARADSLFACERRAEALPLLKQYLARNPHAADAGRRAAQAAICLADAEQWTAARDALLSHTTSPIDPGALRYVAARCAQQEHPVAAELFELLAKHARTDAEQAAAMTDLAWHLWRRGDASAAETALERLQAAHPQLPATHETIWTAAQLLEKAGRTQDALAHYQWLAAHRVQDRDAPRLAAARLLEKSGADDDALTLLSQLSDTARESAEALHLRAWALVDTGQAAAAESLFLELAARFPESRFRVEASYRAAEHQLRGGKPAAALETLRPLAALDGLRGHALYPHVLLLNGQAQAALGEWRRAEGPLRELDALGLSSPVAAEGRFWLAESLFRQRDFDASQTVLSALLEPHAALPNAALQNAALQNAALQNAEPPNAALQNAEPPNAAPAPPWRPAALLRAAQILAHQQKWREALRLATRQRDAYPDHSRRFETDYLIGRCLATQARFDEAREAYHRVVDAAAAPPATAAKAQWMIGETYLHQRRFNDAIRAYHRVGLRNGGPHWSALALLQAGKCHEQLGQWRDGASLYEELLREWPEAAPAGEARRRLAAAEAQLGQPANAGDHPRREHPGDSSNGNGSASGSTSTSTSTSTSGSTSASAS